MIFSFFHGGKKERSESMRSVENVWWARARKWSLEFSVRVKPSFGGKKHARFLPVATRQQLWSKTKTSQFTLSDMSFSKNTHCWYQFFFCFGVACKQYGASNYCVMVKPLYFYDHFLVFPGTTLIFPSMTPARDSRYKPRKGKYCCFAEPYRCFFL